MSEAAVVQGKPWNKHSVRVTFEEADKIRNDILREAGMQVKVKRVQGGFAVKVRTDPTVEIVEEKATPKSKKKQKASS